MNDKGRELGSGLGWKKTGKGEVGGVSQTSLFYEKCSVAGGVSSGTSTKKKKH